MKKVELALLALVLTTALLATEADFVLDRVCANQCVDAQEACVADCNRRNIGNFDRCYTNCDKRRKLCALACGHQT
ncbi:hypothetical protein NP493_1585g00000 [Ridgeia piscesae]|uniref:Uncharacterized protein n=1 Tax=Ridgeia piscesae TaxID=27915 RepID=A0AAD9NAG1_RIDPI|nr:hypothetical protein NP493_1585g00000 [Ridgeia piscesae]